MLTPDTDAVRARSELLRLRFPSDDPEKDAELEALLADDAPVISSLTGRSIGPGDTPGEEVPLYLQPVAIRVFAMRAERHAVMYSRRKRQGTIGALSLRSFTAGPYSESYFGPGEAATAKVLDPDPAIHELLWALATEEKREEWLLLWGLARHAPAAAAQQFDFRGQRGRY